MNDTEKTVGETSNDCKQEGGAISEKQEEVKIVYSNGQDVAPENDMKNGENKGVNGDDVCVEDKEICSQQQTEENADSECVKVDANAPKENDSRSETPQNNKSFSSNGSDEPSANVLPMEPLVLEEDVESELQFDENSDKDSGKSSPTLLRCVTRRSQTRNIPTPKTPKLQVMEQIEDEKTATPEPTVLNQTTLIETSQDDLSTKVAVGNESTRLNFTIGDEFCSSFLSSNKQTPVGEALRRLSVRPSLRSMNDTTRKSADRDSHLLYQRRSVESISGIKRKRPSYTTEEDSTKKTKTGSPGFFSYVTSPISNILGGFSKKDSGPSASTPKPTLKIKSNPPEHANANISAADECVPEQTNKWCILM